MGFSALPNELRRTIFENIRAKEDMKAVSLVCCNWHANMAPLMWYTLNTDLRSTPSRSLIALLGPESMITPHIRRITTGKLWQYTGERRLRLLLAALPQDTLTHFKATTPDLEPATVLLLLQTQRKLKELDARILYNGKLMRNRRLANSHTWIRPLLSELTGLVTHYDAEGCSPAVADERFGFYHNVLECVPKLKTLSIVAKWLAMEPMLDLGRILEQDHVTPKFPNLTSLLLEGVDMGKSFTTLSRNVELSNLRTLALVGCAEFPVFLDQLLNYYTAKDGGELSDLKVHITFFRSSGPDQEIQALERFLRDGPKLTRLILDTASQNLVNKDCIIAHANNLTTLRLGMSGIVRPLPYYAVHDVKAILNACQKLEDISINLPDVHLGDIRHTANNSQLWGVQSGVAYVETEFEAVLTALAQHTPLHTLAMLNYPSITYLKANFPEYGRPLQISWAEKVFCRILYQRFATQVMRFMAERGTAPPIFHSPKLTPNQYTWPAFIFGKGETRDHDGRKEIVAVELKKNPGITNDSFAMCSYTRYIQ